MPSFKLVSQYRYWWPVTVSIPDPEKPGAVIAQTFEMEFEPVPLAQVEALDREANDLIRNGDKAAGERVLLARVCRNWRGVEAEDGGAVAFTDEALRQAMEFPYFRAGAYEAYAESQSGRARLGN